MASGHGVPKPNMAGHPNRMVSRQDWHNAQRSDSLPVVQQDWHNAQRSDSPAFAPPTGTPAKTPLGTPGAGVWQRTEQGMWARAAGPRMSKPNPGGYSPDEIRNIMRDSGP